MSNQLSKFSTNHRERYHGCTLHFDWLKVWKAGGPVLPKTLQFNRLLGKILESELIFGGF